MTVRLRRWFASILSIFFGSTIVASCAPAYAGPPSIAYAGPSPFLFKGRVMDKDTAQIIAGIRVSLIHEGITNIDISDTNYSIQFYHYTSDVVVIAEDIDGATNGSYLPTNFTITIPMTFQGYTTNIDILMTTNG